MRRAALIAALLWFGCDDDGSSAAEDLLMSAVDLRGSTTQDLAVNVDGFCPVQFGGFAGVSDVERRLDCGTCGCSIDRMLGNSVQGFWATPTSSGGRVVPRLGMGMETVVDSTNLTEFAYLVSTPPGVSFFLDGDFDVSAAYELVGALPDDSRAQMILDGNGTTYRIERVRTAAGFDQAEATFSGVFPALQPNANRSGTLRIYRRGSQVSAVADGFLVSQFTASPGERVSLLLGATRGACTVGDAGTCAFTARWHDVAMAGGALVDRR